MKPVQLAAAGLVALCAVATHAAAQIAYTDATPDGARITVPVSPSAPLPVTMKAGSALIGAVTIAPSSSSAVGLAPVASSAAEACHVLKASAGNLYSASGYIGAAGWIMLFNATSAPADGAVTPTAWAYVPNAGSWSINYGDVPAYHGTGITVCASSTGPLTKTAYSTNTVFSGRVQ